MEMKDPESIVAKMKNLIGPLAHPNCLDYVERQARRVDGDGRQGRSECGVRDGCKYVKFVLHLKLLLLYILLDDVECHAWVYVSGSVVCLGM